MIRASLPPERSRLLFAVALAMCLSLLVGCDNGATPTPTIPASANTTTPAPSATETLDLSEVPTFIPVESPTTPKVAELKAAERVELYALAVLALLDKEEASNVYISPYIGEGERLDNPNEDATVPESLPHSLRSSSKSRTYELLDFGEAVGPLEEGGKVKDDGVFVTLGPIVEDESAEGTVSVRASIYRKVGDAEGYLYRFKRDPSSSDGWSLQDSTSEWSGP